MWRRLTTGVIRDLASGTLLGVFLLPALLQLFRTRATVVAPRED